MSVVSSARSLRIGTQISLSSGLSDTSNIGALFNLKNYLPQVMWCFSLPFKSPEWLTSNESMDSSLWCDILNAFFKCAAFQARTLHSSGEHVVSCWWGPYLWRRCLGSNLLTARVWCIDRQSCEGGFHWLLQMIFSSGTTRRDNCASQNVNKNSLSTVATTGNESAPSRLLLQHSTRNARWCACPSWLAPSRVRAPNKLFGCRLRPLKYSLPRLDPAINTRTPAEGRAHPLQQ